ncbi:MAG: hypothetical protein H6766_04930 [Candidatus Peribacteria bacterium]|nr:MAG: hypothetical protein H6766_04930 [Candidatus Peribacteria bacterium]
MKTTVDKIDRKEKKQKTIDKTAGVYDFSAMSIDEQKAKDIRTFFRGNELTIQKPSSDDNLLEIAQARNLTKLHLVSKSAPSPDKIKDIGSSAPSPDKIKDIGSSAPSPDKIKDIGSSAPSPDKIKDIHDKYYIDTLDLQGVDMTTLATDAYKNAIADYSNLSVQSEAASTPSADQWKSLMSFQGNLTIDQPITINLKDL